MPSGARHEREEPRLARDRSRLARDRSPPAHFRSRQVGDQPSACALGARLARSGCRSVGDQGLRGPPRSLLARFWALRVADQGFGHAKSGSGQPERRLWGRSWAFRRADQGSWRRFVGLGALLGASGPVERGPHASPLPPAVLPEPVDRPSAFGAPAALKPGGPPGAGRAAGLRCSRGDSCSTTAEG